MKLKHASGIYKMMPHSPAAEDIMYVMSSKKSTSIADLVKIFGESKTELINKSIGKLIESGQITNIDGIYKIAA